MAVRGVTLARYAGPCWRAVMRGGKDSALDGTVKAGRYNRPGDATLYMSGSPTGVEAAMARYGTADRVLVRLEVSADRLVDLRDAAMCAELGIDPARVTGNWLAAFDRGEDAASWLAADRAREADAVGLIDASRRAPGEWHLVLFRWNCAGGAEVIVSPTRE